MATRKFNIDEVVAGAEIVQRSGEPGKFVMYVEESSDEDNVLWLDEKDSIQFSHPDGSYYGPGEGNISERDLFIWEPDPEPKKIVQLYVGERNTNGYTNSLWEDTCWESVEIAKRGFPKPVYREVSGFVPEYEKVPYVQ